MNDKNEEMAAALERTGWYKVLRRLRPGTRCSTELKEPRRNGLFIDLETTGLDPRTDEVIEIACLPFTFTDEGVIVDILPPFVSLRQPSKPIPEKIAKLTGISNEMVAGRTIDPESLAAIITSADLVVAHNAKFDRPFAERLHHGFKAKPWACSMTQALWNEHGFEGIKLKYLLTSAGFFHDGHRALDDCFAAVELLSQPLGESGRAALAHVLDATARTTVRIWAVHAPYDKKDILRARVYRWNAGDNGRPRAWYCDVDEEAQGDEIAFLRQEIFGPEWRPVTTRITAIDRFSDRV